MSNWTDRGPPCCSSTAGQMGISRCETGHLKPALDLWPFRLLRDDGVLHWGHFVQTLWIAGAALLVRALLEATLLRALRRALPSPKGTPGQSRARGVFDNLYIVGWALVTEVLAIYVTFNINGGCTPFSTDSCLTGWPHHQVHVLQKWQMILTFQIYLHDLVGAAINVGPRLKPDMVLHHATAMIMIFIGYCINLNRYAIMWQALFDTSAPILPAVKALHSAAIPRFDTFKWACFGVFALVFFLARVVMGPISILMPAYMRAFDVLPSHWAAVFLTLMTVLCGMQFVWFYKIVQMAMGRGPKADTGQTAHDADATVIVKQGPNGAARKGTGSVCADSPAGECKEE